MIDVDKYLDSYLTSFSRLNNAHFYGTASLPRMETIEELETSLMDVFFPGRDKSRADDGFEETVRDELRHFVSILEDVIFLAWKYDSKGKNITDKELHRMTDDVIDKLLSELGQLRVLLKKDAEAGLAGDPAAKSLHEVIICYPAIRAIASHRVAHKLFKEGVPLIPRMMNEVIHSQTGIDIHPGAEIGESFFIDHGTGVVIGETTVIGNNVKLYQGVTLGALSFPKDSCGMLLRGAKRHPTIEDNVTIYANATILGDITIGRGSTIGSSAWIKTDIPAETRVMIADPEIILKTRIRHD